VSEEVCRNLGSAVPATQRYNFQPPTPTLSATMHGVAALTGTERRVRWQYRDNSRSYCVGYCCCEQIFTLRYAITRLLLIEQCVGVFYQVYTLTAIASE